MVPCENARPFIIGFQFWSVAGLEYFKNVLLVSSFQDKYVPPHSARIEVCERALKDDSPFGRAYRTMVDNILSPLINKPGLKFVRYDVSFPLSASTANNLIGRAAHIAVLDSEVWLEKFFTIVGLKYFTWYCKCSTVPLFFFHITMKFEAMKQLDGFRNMLLMTIPAS